MVSVRAVYRDGHLRLLEPVDLSEGQVVHVTIGLEHEQPSVEKIDDRLRAAGLLLGTDDPVEGVELSAEDRSRIGHLFVGERRSDDLIDEDRGQY